MNKFGWLSLITVGISIIITFFINEQTKSPGIFLLFFSILSITGIIFAFLSKKITNILLGVCLNFITFVFLFFLILAFGIGEG
ncbi:hypothetical protein RAH41_07945 [Gottfriedia acidiceleris]|uniref:hypothetical protein n=1 Tax=Gottfriedia acidiceleris TaxID=371036 RepID=UPI002F26573E